MKRMIASAAAVAVGVWACSPPAPATKTVKIGVVIDRTGNNAEASWSDAIKLAEKQLNEALTKAQKSYRFSFEINDSQNDPMVAVTRATALVKEQGVKALILDSSQNDIAVNKLHYDADMTNDLNVPLMCGGCTSGSINNPAATSADMAEQASNRNALGWNFKGIMSTRLIASVLVKDMMMSNRGDANNDGKFKLAVYASDESFGRATTTDFKTFATAARADATFKELRHSNAVDVNTYGWGADIAKLVEQTRSLPDGGTEADQAVPDFVAVANFAQQQAAVVRAYKTGNNTPKMVHVHTMRINSAIAGLGALAEGVEGVSHVLVDNAESGDVFRADFEKEYGKPIVYRDAIYYDIAVSFGLGFIIAAEGQADPTAITGEAVRDGVKKISAADGEVVRTGVTELGKALTAVAGAKTINYEGAGGSMNFDANQSVRNRLAKYRVEGGKFVDVAKFDCFKDDNCDPLP